MIREVPARASLPVDEEEMLRWLRWLCDRGYKESTGKIWISRIRTAYAHGVKDEEVVDAVFVNYANTTRGGMRQALRELDKFRRSA